MYVFGWGRRILGYSYGPRESRKGNLSGGDSATVVHHAPHSCLRLWREMFRGIDPDRGALCVHVLGFVGCEAYFKSCYNVGVVLGTV
jgi:hypothetical protein